MNERWRRLRLDHGICQGTAVSVLFLLDNALLEAVHMTSAGILLLVTGSVLTSRSESCSDADLDVTTGSGH